MAMETSFEKELAQVLFDHQRRQQRQHPQSNGVIVDEIHRLVQSFSPTAASTTVDDRKENKPTNQTTVDYKVLAIMYQQAVKSSGNQVDDQAKYLTPRLLQEMGLVGNRSTTATTTHGDEVLPEEQEQEQQQKQQAAIVALSELSFGLSHQPLEGQSIKTEMPTKIITTSTVASIGGDVPSATLARLQETGEKKKPAAAAAAAVDTSTFSCSSSLTSTLTMSSILDDDAPSNASNQHDNKSLEFPWPCGGQAEENMEKEERVEEKMEKQEKEEERAEEKMEKQEENHELLFNCPVCMEDFPESQTMTFFCSYYEDNQQNQPSLAESSMQSSPHLLCRECAVQYVQSNQDQLPLKCFVPNCKHELLPQEIALVLGHGNMEVGFQSPLYRQLDVRQRDWAIAQDPADYVHCPAPQCHWRAARSMRGAKERVTCPLCYTRFCSNCNDRYHYRSTCVEWIQIRQTWENWKLDGRARYWKTRNKEISKRAQDVAKAERKRVHRVRAIEQADEMYKAAHCRHCPRCNRLVERIEGCAIMYCGRDAHGSNYQPGCGQKFDWNKDARPYEPIEAGQQVQLDTQKALDEDSKPLLHEHELCDHCGSNKVHGLLFECVNCPCYKLCERCEVDVDNFHDKNHCFVIKQPQRPAMI